MCSVCIYVIGIAATGKQGNDLGEDVQEFILFAIFFALVY